MNIIISLTDRHVDALCSAYGHDGSADPKAKLIFAMDRIAIYIDEIAKANDLVTAAEAAKDAKAEEIKDLPKPDVSEGAGG